MTIPQITTVSLPSGLQNQPYSFQLQATGGIYPLIWSGSITPNTGGQFSLNPITGAISGTPTTAETETVTVQVSDSMTPHNTAQASFTFAVNTTVVITTTTPLPLGTVTVPYSTAISATGGTPPYTWAMSPPNLDGLTLNATTGVLSGTPTTATTVTGVFTATDSASIPSAPVSLSLTVQAAGSTPDPPSAMWPGVVSSDRAHFQWWPMASMNVAATPQPPSGVNGFAPDPNTYNVYRSDRGSTPIATGIVPVITTGPSTIKFYHYQDSGVAPSAPLLPNTSYTYTVTTVSPTGVESAPGPTLTVTTLMGGATAPTPPTPVIDPSTWIAPFALPNPANGTIWRCTDHTAADVSGTGTSGPGNTVTGCSLTHAFANVALGGGDTIVLDAGAIYATTPAGYNLPAITGVNDWTYVISSEDPVLKAGGILPPYVDASAGPNYPFPLTLTAAPGIGATSATLTAASTWRNKTGVYPVQFYAAAGSNKNEQRYVLFTKNSTAISWSAHNPNGIDGTLGAGLVIAAGTIISVAYLPGVNLYERDQNAMPVIQFGGTGTNGVGFAQTNKLNKVRFVGIAMQPAPTNPTDNAFYHNFYCFVMNAGCTNVYFDRCMFGSDPATFTTSGWTAGGGVPTVTSTTYGFCQVGVGNLHCDNFLMHQSYFQGIACNPNGTAQDSSCMFGLGNGPYCLQYNYLASVSEGVIFGGGPVGNPTNFNLPHDLTYRYNFNTKPQWWNSAYQTLTLITPPPTPQTFTGNGTVGPYNITAGVSESFRFGVTINGVLQASSTYTLTLHPAPTSDTITFASPVANGAAVSVRGPGKLIFADYVKNLLELKVMLGANIYGNVHWNCWYSNVSGYLGDSFTMTARDQRSSAPATGPFATSVFGTCPWSGKIFDIDCHDNISIGVSQAQNPFSNTDYSPTSWSTRLRFRNNLTHLQLPWNSTAITLYRGKLEASQPQGLMPDFIFDHNTFVADQTNSIVPGSTTSLYFIPGRFDRYTITNNIFPGARAVTGDSGFTLNSTSMINPSGGGWNNNLTVFDNTGPFPAGSLTYTAKPYATIGFANFQDEFHPPAQPSDWNVVNSTFVGTDGLPVGATFAAQQFPLLGAYLIAGSVQTSFGTTAFQQSVAKTDVAVIGLLPNWTSGGFTLNSAAAAVKAINPATKLFPYTNIMELEPGVGTSGSAYSPIFNAATTGNWFTRNPWPGGPVVDVDGLSQQGLNCTTFTTGLVGGQTYLDWRAAWTAANEFASNWDGVYMDNVSQGNNFTGNVDFRQTGTSVAANSTTAKQDFRTGNATYVPKLRAVLPAGKNVIGNIADWGNSPITGYPGILDGGVMEHAIGQGFSYEAQSWTILKNYYALVMNSVNAPKYVIFVQDAAGTNYAGMRYGLCTCLLDNAYYANSGNGGYGSITLLDEFNFNLGSPIAGPNNPANGTISSGGLAVWSQGVWRRDFQNGIILVNPRGNGAKTVTLETTYYHLRASTYANQDPTTNNGAAVTSVTLPDSGVAGTGGSGLFLSRTPT